MAKRVLLCLSHSIEEYDQLRLLSSLGYEVASIGGYIDPAHPHDPKRPAISAVPCHQVVKDAVDQLGTTDNLGAAQSAIPPAILEWLGPDGVLIFHHYLDARLWPQWGHLAEWRAAGGRVIWRTVGQSVENNERIAEPYRRDGLEIVRYSPKEREIPGYAGEDALIRFYKDETEWDGWTGEEQRVINFTQHLRARDPYTNWRFWLQATSGLPAEPLGPGSDNGELSEEDMLGCLQRARCYLYTGTQPASYTLGLLEALMVGIPVVSIGPAWMDVFPYGPQLFEGHELAPFWSDDPRLARCELEDLLDDGAHAVSVSVRQRQRAVEMFGLKQASDGWRAYLGAP
ncbi:MAG TPA: hypothetical protein VG265_07290 [Gaiellaceae bacterium]|jgi:hypothetical protein|nr:hypothetical protein [Gaiellaceae bacterium]